MKQEDKELLLKDLCARLPYGINVLLDLEKQFDGGSICTLTSIDVKTSNAIFHVDVTLMDLQIEEIRPYLRPMSSMTEEESIKFEGFKIKSLNSVNVPNSIEAIDWLNAHHFDYRGLIEKGLAMEASEDMYKN